MATSHGKFLTFPWFIFQIELNSQKMLHGSLHGAMPMQLTINAINYDFRIYINLYIYMYIYFNYMFAVNLNLIHKMPPHSELPKCLWPRHKENCWQQHEVLPIKRHHMQCAWPCACIAWQCCNDYHMRSRCRPKWSLTNADQTTPRTWIEMI